MQRASTFAVIMRCVFGVSDDERLAELGRIFREMLTWVTDTRRGLHTRRSAPTG